MSQMTPREIVQELDNHIIGQDEVPQELEKQRSLEDLLG